MPWQYSVRTHLIIAFSVCLVGTGTAWWFFTNHSSTVLPWIANGLLVVNVVTFAYYGLDKYLAQRSLWRIPELVLHTLSAFGGSPGALMAMSLFRHKTIKSSFRILFWSIVVLQIALAAYVVKLLWWD